MTITIELTTGNAAFTGDYLGMAGEAARILEALADCIRTSASSDLIGTAHPLHDALGNCVGEPRIEGMEIVG